MKRVVITGMGAVSAFGTGTERLWQALLAGKNGITRISHLPLQGDIVAIGAAIPNLEKEIQAIPKLAAMSCQDPSVKSFFLAVHEAVTQAKLDFTELNLAKVATMIADRPFSPTSLMAQFLPSIKQSLTNENIASLSPLQYWQALQNDNDLKQSYRCDERDSINHFVSRYYQLTGPTLSIGTACASGNNGIGEAFEKIRHGRLDCALAGGAYDFDMNSMVGFTRIGALSTHNCPDTACRPFDAKRSGFVMGSGCGVLIMESLEHAQARGADILCEVTGYASYSDGYRATDPDPSGMGAQRTLRGALATAQLAPEQIGYINAHGTSTTMNDKTETNAIKAVFGEHAYQLPISSTKSMIGHGIMAAGALEAVACINALRDQTIHGTRNYQHRDPELDLDYVAEGARQLTLNHVLSNNFGFGGQNASVIYSRFVAQ
ncbi:beta-ketoacyl-[acyl-carrier-protein] synthase family protein [Motilimonas cestriensis]|uniref:Beta-ketoacyl-[acyl-carrier-protein] synthase family protein n=1 Tax=Motilimonas cestriensis TaxID=2742685 RepID=A0ABS8W896_9GAMM|nr:beta-ketoacyl-[acyl-carrier-protein] synthase family protein [Motilimonas cestriensis]MCE2595224.1 beta-ketoacyl-[acyl-carrier-protein] synthase family protein [Motilimonas cestriensis]